VPGATCSPGSITGGMVSGSVRRRNASAHEWNRQGSPPGHSCGLSGPVRRPRRSRIPGSSRRRDLRQLAGTGSETEGLHRIRRLLNDRGFRGGIVASVLHPCQPSPPFLMERSVEVRVLSAAPAFAPRNGPLRSTSKLITSSDHGGRNRVDGRAARQRLACWKDSGLIVQVSLWCRDRVLPGERPPETLHLLFLLSWGSGHLSRDSGCLSSESPAR
jgi:hypothetical protein